jgi:hypothetical protein
MRLTLQSLAASALLIAAPVSAPASQSAAFAAAAQAADPLSIASLRAGLAGQWTGTLEYRDYTANEWFGIPMSVRIEDVGDGATLIRHGQFDDGPVVGIVRITTVLFYDSAAGTEITGMFRRGRAVEQVRYDLALSGTPRDATHWTMVALTESRDDNRPARLRETTTRDGDTITTLKEIDWTDEAGENWLVRNRTTLRRIGD